MIINRTPHSIKIDDTVYEPVKPAIRAEQSHKEVGTIDGVTEVTMKFGKPIGLPPYKEGVYYIVSLIVARAAKETGRTTKDLLITALPTRDESGRINGCRAVSRLEDDYE